MDSYGSARFLQQVIVNRVSQNGGISWLADEMSLINARLIPSNTSFYC